MSESMVERVARAVRRNKFVRTRRIASFDETVPPTDEEIDDARAAIAAMREPTPEMSEAAFQIEASGYSQRTLLEAGWRAMIDAALDPADCVRETGKA
jgi:hypothetical protein